jgi:hypothetical protein
LIEGELTFRFPVPWRAIQHDRTVFHRRQFQRVGGGSKAVDIFAIEPDGHLWAIEVKDYRRERRTKTIDLADEVALKVRDSLAALVAAHMNATDAAEKDFASFALACSRAHVVLHLEQPRKHSKLFPRAIDPANVLQKLKQSIKAIDSHPKVLELGRPGDVAWSVQVLRRR